MARKKHPSSLFEASLKASVLQIQHICDRLLGENGTSHELNNSSKYDKVKGYLYNFVPGSLWNNIYEFSSLLSAKDPSIQLSILAHPCLKNLTNDPDQRIQESLWLELIPKLNNLVRLNLKGVCTDDILLIVGNYCPYLEELNTISRLDISKLGKVSNTGLHHISSLTNLKILTIDQPMDKMPNTRNLKYITKNGIRSILQELPNLEELNIDQLSNATYYDVTTVIIDKPFARELKLKKINHTHASPRSVRKLLKTCPHVTDLSLEIYSQFNDNNILAELTNTDVQFRSIELLFFGFTSVMANLLIIKGSSITSFSLVEMDPYLTFSSILLIGECCPNLYELRLKSLSDILLSSDSHPNNTDKKTFLNLSNIFLCLECDDVLDILLFFIKSPGKIKKIDLQLIDVTNLDSFFENAIKCGFLNCLEYLSLDPPNTLTLNALKLIINRCEKINHIKVDSHDTEHLTDYIKTNNLDLIFEPWYYR